MVYMGGNDSDDPDEILTKNHQMLVSVHSGRLIIISHFDFKSGFSFFFLDFPFFIAEFG